MSTLSTRHRLPRLAVTAVALAVALVLTGAPAGAAAPEGTILHAGGATSIADRYIVVLKDSEVTRADVEVLAERLAAKFGGSVGFVYEDALRGFEIQVNQRAAARIAALPQVDYVEQVHTVQLAATQSNPPSWGLDRIDQRNLPLDNSYTYPNTASGVNVYIIDTGIRRTHNDFGGRAFTGFDAVTSGGSANDCHGHGTHVAGTVGGTAHGVAKQVRLYAVRVLNCSGNGTTAQVVAGVNWVTANAVRPAVANMSLGGGANTSIDNAVRNSIASGVTYAVAAGNGNIFGIRQNACNYSPARVSTAITVGATQSNDQAASFSNYGTCVNILAPGVNIVSTWSSGDTATRSLSGTSMATPHVAAAAAMVLQANPTWSPAQVKSYLESTATTGVIGNPGSGTPNRLLYVS